MDDIVQYMIPLGYGGMGIASFIAGSVLPFSSETLLAGLLLAGLHPWPLFVSATIGNVLGSMFNYCVGRLGSARRLKRLSDGCRDGALGWAFSVSCLSWEVLFR